MKAAFKRLQAPAAPKSSLEIMLETIRKRDEQRQNDDEHFLPPSPARPRGRGRPPTTPGRRPLPAVWFKIGNGDGAGTVPADKRPGVGKGGAAISNDGDGAAGVVHNAATILVDDDSSHDTESFMRAEGGVTVSNDAAVADVFRPAVETVVVEDDMYSVSQDAEDQCMRAEGRGTVLGPTPRPHSMVIQDVDEDGTAITINHGATATDVVDFAKQQDTESEIVVEDARINTMIMPGGGGATADVRAVRPSASTTSGAGQLERRAPRPSVSPPWSSSGSSRESEPEKRRTKVGVGKLLSGSTSCVRAPVAAVARMALKICGSSSAGARALDEHTDQEAETSLLVHGAAVKPPVVPSGGGGADTSTAKPLPAAFSMPTNLSRSGVVWRWLKKISGQLTSRSTPQPQIIASLAPAEGTGGTEEAVASPRRVRAVSDIKRA